MHLQTSCSSSSSAPFGTTGEKNQYKNLKRRRLDFQGQCQGQPSVESFQTMTSPSWHYVNSSNSPPGRNRTSFHCDGSPAKVLLIYYELNWISFTMCEPLLNTCMAYSNSAADLLSFNSASHSLSGQFDNSSQ